MVDPDDSKDIIEHSIEPRHIAWAMIEGFPWFVDTCITSTIEKDEPHIESTIAP